MLPGDEETDLVKHFRLSPQFTAEIIGNERDLEECVDTTPSVSVARMLNRYQKIPANNSGHQTVIIGAINQIGDPCAITAAAEDGVSGRNQAASQTPANAPQAQSGDQIRDIAVSTVDQQLHGLNNAAAANVRATLWAEKRPPSVNSRLTGTHSTASMTTS